MRIRPSARASLPVLAGFILLPLALASCGGNDETNKGSRPETTTPASPTSTPSDSEQNAACRRLGRTWAVSADDLRVVLTLPTDAKFQELSEAMSDATDQMEIEQCEGKIRQLATRGNYELSLLAFDVIKCEQQSGFEPCPAGDKWQKKGDPIVAKVKELSSD